MNVYRLPSCDWFSRGVYTASPFAIGSHAEYILPPLLRLVLTRRGKVAHADLAARLRKRIEEARALRKAEESKRKAQDAKDWRKKVAAPSQTPLRPRLGSPLRPTLGPESRPRIEPRVLESERAKEQVQRKLAREGPARSPLHPLYTPATPPQHLGLVQGTSTLHTELAPGNPGRLDLTDKSPLHLEDASGILHVSSGFEAHEAHYT
eukprot:5923097-Pyramimonas_sp.AAC.1